MSFVRQHLIWLVVAVLGASTLTTAALARGEAVSALWVVVAAVCIYLIAYRYYSRLIADKVLGLDNTRKTPAWRYNGGLDCVPTSKHVLFGHHFAAIAGADPLVGPVLVTQMGYLPGMLQILAGVVLAGAVQDFIVLFISSRRDGRSLGGLVKSEVGTVLGVIALFGALLIMITTLAVLASIVMKALVGSPWGTFMVTATIPIALFMGMYVCYVHLGHTGEIFIIGFALLMPIIIGGQAVHKNVTLASLFTFDGKVLAWILIGYGFVTSVLPVWLSLAPRDYLSTLLKTGTIMALAIGILIVASQMQTPSLTQFAGGDGSVWSGNMFPFLFITIAYGMVPGFHSLVASGTTPKLLENERQTRLIGYGAMLMESFVAIMALVAVSVIDPGMYFAMNSPAALMGVTPDTVAHTLSIWGFVIPPDVLIQIAKDVGENTILARVGGASMLAVGMAHILYQVVGDQTMMVFWYHFVILFEVLFILTAVDVGMRAGRFMLQDLLGTFVPALKCTDSLVANLVATTATVALWDYFLYQGIVDPLGGINTLWPLFGISNQMLTVTALTPGICVLVKTKRDCYVWVMLLPTLWPLLCMLTIGWQKLFDPDPKIGFLAHANKYASATAEGKLLTLAKSMTQMQQVVLNDCIDAFLCGPLIFVVASIVWHGLRTVFRACAASRPTANETPYEALGA